MYRKDPDLKIPADNFVLSDEQAVEYEKCKNDIFYFAKYFNIISSNGIEPIKLQKHQIAIINDLLNPGENKQNNIFMLPRQTGKSTILALFGLWYTMFTPNICTGIIANKLCMAQEILLKMKTAYHMMPFWLQTGLDINRNGCWSAERICLANGSYIFTAGGGSPSSVRGKTVDLLLIDEFTCFSQKNQKDFMMSVFQCQTARKSSKMIICATPHGFDEFYELWRKSVNDVTSFKATKFDITECNPEIYNDEWIEKMINTYGELFFEQEYMCKFLGSKECDSANKIKSKEEQQKIIINKIKKLLDDLEQL